MKTFRFFFALSLGIALFLFFLRFALIAFVAAAVLSLGYFAVRKMKQFFGHNDDPYQRGPIREEAYKAEPLFSPRTVRMEPMERYRNIDIR